jgi:TRAP transporter TAXI family solute receptor
MLYPDGLHVVARKDSGIQGIADLRGKRVSLGDKGSGTMADALIVLAAHGIREGDLTAAYLRAGAAAEQFAKGELDAFFVIDGPPVPAVAELARTMPLAVLPIDGDIGARLREAHPFFLEGTIPPGTYAGLDQPVPTLDVGVVLLVGAKVPDELVYGITKALWHPSTQKLLSAGHPRGRLIRLEAATERLGLQLHPGAAAFYFDAGIVR